MSDSKTSRDVSSPKEVDSTTSMTNPSRLPAVDLLLLPLLPLMYGGGGGGSKAYPPDDLDDDEDDDDGLLRP